MHKVSTKGFTLIELVIGMLIFGILGSAVTLVFVNGLNFTRNEKTQILHQLSLTDFSLRLEGDVRMSSSASVSGGCLVLVQESTLRYCHDTRTQKVFRNDVPVADLIETFILSVDPPHIQIKIATKLDDRNVSNALELNYVLRQGSY